MSIINGVQSRKISESDLAIYRQAFAAFGGEIIEVNDGISVVIKFDDVKKMMKIIDGLKARDSRFVFNSKKVDGSHICTMSKSR